MQYAPEAALGYERIRWHPREGEPLGLDPNYRTAHLPLIAPAHPDVISRSVDGIYQQGRYAKTRISLVLPVLASELETSAEFRRLDEAVRASSFAEKVAWDVMAKRRRFLHATLRADLREDAIPALVILLQRHFVESGGFSFRMAGPLLGQKNLGRIYFPLFPELRDGANALHLLQDLVGEGPRTDIFLVGYYSLRDHLDAQETADLKKILQACERSTLLEAQCRELWLLATNDDLVLSGKIRHVVSAGETSTSRTAG